MKVLARALAPPVALGQTKFDPQVLVHENAVFLYKQYTPYRLIRFMTTIDCTLAFILLLSTLPLVTNPVAFLVPMFLFLVRRDY